MISEQQTLNKFSTLRISLSGTTIHRTTVNQNSSKTRRHEVNEARRHKMSVCGGPYIWERCIVGPITTSSWLTEATPIWNTSTHQSREIKHIQKQFRYIEYLKVITANKSNNRFDLNLFTKFTKLHFQKSIKKIKLIDKNVSKNTALSQNSTGNKLRINFTQLCIVVLNSIGFSEENDSSRVQRG